MRKHFLNFLLKEIRPCAYLLFSRFHTVLFVDRFRSLGCHCRRKSKNEVAFFDVAGNLATPTDSENSYEVESANTENSATKGSLSGTVDSPGEKFTSEQEGEDSPSFDGGTQEDFVVMENGHAQRVAYVAGPILYNVTLRLGIKAGKFTDKGRQKGMSECIRTCGKEPSCDLAFMLGKQCFAVTCNKGESCHTKPTFSKFFNPQIAYVKHRALANKGRRSASYFCAKYDF